MAWHTHPRTLATSCVLLLTACGDSGGREDSGSTPVTTGASIVPQTDGGDTSEPTTNVVVTDGSATASGTGTSTGGSDDSTTSPITSTTITTGDPTGDTLTSTTDVGSTGGGPCLMGQIECEGNTAKVCDGQGGFSSEEVCSKVCLEGKGCAECVPDSKTCEGEVSKICNEEGSGTVDVLCDAVQGVTCDPNAGACVGVCSPDELKLSYIGCDYYPTVTANIVTNTFNFAVAVANTTGKAAAIRIERAGNIVKMDSVPPNGVKVITLPWVNELKANENASSLVAVDGAYRLRSDQPVTVYQFSPIEYAQGGFSNSFTNDASLMLPVNTWTGNYLVAAWQHWDALGLPGFYSVTASQDNTTVTLKAPKGGTPTQPGGGVDGSGNGVVVLNEGDVLQLITASGGELTGSIVSADKPVQVLGGHECSNVPQNIAACDHLEESMFPIEALATEYIVVPPVQVPNDAAEKAIIVRVVASEANTTLPFDPDQPVNKLLANAGDFVEIPSTTAKFVVKADKKILVAQYMVGQSANFGTSDPAMLLAVPTAQFRSSYLFYAQTGWQANYVDIIAPTGANVMVDGAAVANFAPIGATSFSLAHVKLSNAGDGTHSVTGDQKVGISVYGVVDYGSYWYPGGLDLDVIPQ